MAITITKDNKTIVLRNLEEQVLKNKEDIAKHYAVDRVIADWGIKVLGVVDTVDNIPVANYEYGDAFGLRSTSPMQYVVWTRANANVGEATDYWLNIGALSLVGPQGPQGIQGNPGPTGKRGSLWTATSGGPNVVGANFLNGDLWLNAANGDVYQYIADDQRWSLKGNIRGPQGVQGPTGPKGEQGIQGPIGPQGPKGDTGSSFKIGGLLESVDNLPIPTEANRSVGYAIKNADGVTYDLYVVVGTYNLQWVNMGRVEGVEGPRGPIGPQGPAGVGATIIPISSSSKGGTLTPTQLETIRTATYPIINLNNEYFVKADIYDSENEFVFSHVGQKNGGIYTKTFRLNTQSGDWALKEMVVEQVLNMNDFDNGDDTFTIPEEYRPFDIISRCILLYRNELHFYSGEYNDDINDYNIVFNSISRINVQPKRLTVSYNSFDIYADGSGEILHVYNEFQPINSVQIIEDQGKIELATYKGDNTIIDVNDSPNQFLQRRLDKPSLIIDKAANFFNIIRNNAEKIYKGQIVAITGEQEIGFADTFKTHYFIIMNFYLDSQGNIILKLAPITFFMYSTQGFVDEVEFNENNNYLEFNFRVLNPIDISDYSFETIRGDKLKLEFF